MAQKKSYKKKQQEKYNRSKHQRNTPAVRAKKHLGQHFLKDEGIAKKIADTLTFQNYKNVIEIGPGMGVLTKYILQHPIHLVAMDLDTESITYLQQHFPIEHPEILGAKAKFEVLEADFLKFDIASLFSGQQFAITGNFPYNISTQIVFKMLENRERIPEFTGMFQKEVAQRICGTAGNKTYGILSVFVQTFYDVEYLFTVGPEVFDPPPKVESGVLRLMRKTTSLLGTCPEKEFYALVKTAFGQRRKTLRNSLKTYEISEELRAQDLFSKRPEQLTVVDFVTLTQQISSGSL